MNCKRTAGPIFLSLVLFAIWTSPAQAALIDRGGGLIYDDVLDITWLQDANYAKTSGFDADGIMTWTDAVGWADALVFGGFDDWRLPTLSPIDGATFDLISSNNATTDAGYAKTTTDGTDGGWRDGTGNPVSEMGHMYYVTLANLGLCTANDADPTSCVVQSGFGLANVGPFLNLQSGIYWSGSELPSSPSNAWNFYFDRGRQGAPVPLKSNEYFAWAVRDGDVGPQSVPVPSTWLLLAAGLAGLGIAARRR